MNTTNILKLVACLTWAGVAVSSATPASAIAVTNQTGSYASCSNASQAATNTFCGTPHNPMDDYDNIYAGDPTVYTSYMQQIKFVSVACSGGGCQGDNGQVYVEGLYGVGRKVVTGLDSCDGYWYKYGLDTCAC
jgi:hypothetical protein